MGASVGITVGVDGESEYSRSLKNITAETKAFQSELKALQSSFGKNTSTWEKSQMTASVLSDEIESQYRKLDALKEAQSKFAEGSTQWFDYADKINKATDALNKMEHQLEALPNHIQAIGEDFKTWGKNIEDSGKKISDLGDKATRKITTPIVAGLTGVVKETADFDTAMAEVKAIAISTQEALGRITPAESEATFDRLREKARQMGRETVFSATESANAMAYLARAGWTADEIINGLDGVMSLAAADGLDLASTASIVADGVTAFGKSAEYSSHFADILAMTSAQSNTNVEMLGESFKYVAPTAAALGYEVEDVALALGLSANNGVKASQAGTGLRQALKNLISPTDKVAAAADKFGISLYDAEGKALPLSDVIAQLRQTFGDLNVEILDGNGDLKEAETIMAEYGDSLPITQQEKLQAIVDIFGTRAMPTMLSVINASTQDFGDLEQAIYNATGAAETMANTRLDNVGGDFTLLKDEILDLAISLGDIAVPVLRNDLIPAIRDVVGWFGGLDEGTKELIIKTALFAATVGPVLSIGGRLISGIGSLVGGVGSLISVLGGLGSAIPTVIGAIGSIGPAIMGVIGGIGSLITAAAPLLAGGAIVAGIGFGVYEIVKHWDDIKAAAKHVGEFLGDCWDGITHAAQDAWNGLTNFLDDTWKEITGLVEGAADGLGSFLWNAWDGISSAANSAWNGLTGIIGSAWDGITSTVMNAASGLANRLSGVWSGIKNAASSAFNGIMDFGRGALKWGGDLVSGMAAGISSGWNTVKGAVSDIAGGIADFLGFSEPDKGPLSNFHTFMPDMIDLMTKGIYQNMGKVMDAADALASVLVPDAEMAASSMSPTTNNTVTNGDIVLNVYGAEGQDVRELARIVEQEITFNINRRSAAYT